MAAGTFFGNDPPLVVLYLYESSLFMYGCWSLLAVCVVNAKRLQTAGPHFVLVLMINGVLSVRGFMA